MVRNRWDHANEHDLPILLAFPAGPHRRALKALLAQVQGRDRARILGRYPRFKIVLAGTGAEALRRAAGARAAAVTWPSPAARGSSSSAACAPRGPPSPSSRWAPPATRRTRWPP